MIILMNSSKTVNFEEPAHISKHTVPEFLADCELLVSELRKLSVSAFAGLMGVSENLATLNVRRYKNWRPSPGRANAKQALFAFKGHIYAAMDVDRHKMKTFDFAQKHLRILSGLYGILRPLDLIQPYRLEMSTKLVTDRGKDMYRFWGTRINASLNKLLKREQSGVLVNLASAEYFKAATPKFLEADVITPVFKEYKAPSYRVVAIYAKKARGLMCDTILQNRITRVTDLQSFNSDGYRFAPALSSQKDWVFTRGDIRTQPGEAGTKLTNDE
jgi:cytoplasmic iron level regulating protein YaaA (DUF328/UPF0246 family)